MDIRAARLNQDNAHNPIASGYRETKTVGYNKGLNREKNILTLRRRVRQQELEAKLKQTHPSICHFRSPPWSDIPETLRLQRVKISHDLPKFNLNTNTVSQKQEHAKFSFNQQHLQRKQNNGPQYLRKGTQASTWYTATGCMIVATSRCKIL